MQLVAFTSQRFQLYTNDVGAFVHVPGAAVSTSPSRAIPLITGGALDTGRDPFGGADPFGVTAAVGADLAVPLPFELLAPTTTIIHLPTSSVVSTSVCPVEESGSQPVPSGCLQWRHSYVYEIGPGPAQVPDVAVKVSPSMAVPEIVGGDVFSGLPSPMTGVGAEVALAEPSELVAVTKTRSLWLESTTSVL